MAVGVDHARTRGCRLLLHLSGKLGKGRNGRWSCIYRHSRWSIGMPWLECSRKNSTSIWTILTLLRGRCVNIDRRNVVGRCVLSGEVIQRHRLTVDVRIHEASGRNMKFFWLAAKCCRPPRGLKGLGGIRHGGSMTNYRHGECPVIANNDKLFKPSSSMSYLAIEVEGLFRREDVWNWGMRNGVEEAPAAPRIGAIWITPERKSKGDLKRHFEHKQLVEGCQEEGIYRRKKQKKDERRSSRCRMLLTHPSPDSRDVPISSPSLLLLLLSSCKLVDYLLVNILLYCIIHPRSIHPSSPPP